MSRAYVRPTIGGWLLPAMVGPWVSILSAASAYAAFGPEPRFIGRWAVWAFGMLAGSLVSTIYVLFQVIADVVLLALRQRQLPVGRDAWFMSLGAPLLVVGSYAMMPRDLYKFGPWAIAAAVLIPIALTTFGVRIAAGQKIAKSR